MRYLFFDIEASDGNYGICEFGFVITDEKFRLLNKQLYLINPQKKFNTIGRPGRPDVNLYFTKEEYRAAPIFPNLYNNIKFALTQKDILIFGHAVGNDINYLRKACERYKLPFIYFDAYDVQKIFSYFASERTRFASLDSVVEKLVPISERANLVEHKSVDDAHLTMLTLKAMVEELEINLIDLIETYPECKVIGKKIIEMKGIMKSVSRGQSIWGECYRSYLSYLELETSKGKKVTISGVIKKSEIDVESVVNKIKESDLVAYDKITGADYFICLDDEDIERMKSTLKYPFEGKFMTLKDFLENDIN